MLQRILAGAIGIPAFILVMWAGGWVFAIAIILISALALKEFYKLASAKSASPNVLFGLAWGISLQVPLAISMQYGGIDNLWLGGAIVVFFLGVVATLGLELWRNREHALLNTSLTVMGVSYVSIGLSMLLVIQNFSLPPFVGSFGEYGTSLVLMLFVSIWVCDSAAYFGGTWLGKHKLFPRVSPKKSWEGAIAGLIGAVVASVSCGELLMPQGGTEHWIMIGLIVGVFGQMGDLAESLLKRDAAIKDSGGVIPGHGGVLDRFDSMLFAAPMVVAYLFLRLIPIGIG